MEVANECEVITSTHPNYGTIVSVQDLLPQKRLAHTEVEQWGKDIV
jgi:hypothetical protein